MESRFQFDFGRVRVHHDPAAERAASGLSARAFTLGPHIAFGEGQYAPETSQGQRLLAHELTHVVQQAQDQSPVLRRAPALKGKAKHQFGDSDSSDIDKAIAASPITKWVPAKNLKKLAGNVDTQSPVVFEKQFEKVGADENVDEVPGFVNRDEKKPIKLRLPGKSSKGQLVVAATFEAAVHETIHLNSNTQFQKDFGHNYNEGVTEYFTEMVLGEPGQAYRDTLKLAEGLIAALGADGEDLVGQAFFQGKRGPYLKTVDAFRNDPNKRHLLEWQQAREKKPPDTQTANTLLTSALSASGSSGGATPAPAGGTSPSQPAIPAE